MKFNFVILFVLFWRGARLIKIASKDTVLYADVILITAIC